MTDSRAVKASKDMMYAIQERPRAHAMTPAERRKRECMFRKEVRRGSPELLFKALDKVGETVEGTTVRPEPDKKMKSTTYGKRRHGEGRASIYRPGRPGWFLVRLIKAGRWTERERQAPLHGPGASQLKGPLDRKTCMVGSARGKRADTIRPCRGHGRTDQADRDIGRRLIRLTASQQRPGS